jgi:hypothetical protein
MRQMKFTVVAELPPHPKGARVWSQSPREAPRVIVAHCAVCTQPFPIFETKMPAKCCAECDRQVRDRMNKRLGARERQRRHRGVA